MDKDENLDTCPNCKQECIMDVCWCGDYEKNHGISSNHGFVPWGCICGYDTPPKVFTEKEIKKN